MTLRLRRRPLPVLLLCCVLLSSLSGAAGAATAADSAPSGGAGAPAAATTASPTPITSPVTATTTAAVSATASATSAQVATPTTPSAGTPATMAGSATPIAPTAMATPVTAALTATQTTSQTIPAKSTAALTPTENATAGATGLSATLTLTPTTPVSATNPATAAASALPTDTAPLTVADTGAGTPPTATVATLNAAAGLTATTDAERLPLSFTPNRGQSDPAVQYLAHVPGFTLFLTGTGATLLLQPRHAHRAPRLLPRPAHAPPALAAAEGTDGAGVTPTAPLSPAVVQLSYAGANPAPPVTGDDQLPGVANYFLGADPSHWETGLPTYAKVTYQGVYPGIDLTYYGHAGQLEYDWVVRPGADPTQIALAISGTRGLATDAQGDLVLRTDGGQLVQHAPVAYQEIGGQRRPVAAAFTLKGATARLTLGAYDPSQPLIVDPVLLYGTYLGGNYDDLGYSVALDSAGAIYLTGDTGSTTYPTRNPYQPAPKGANGCLGGSCEDAILTKLSPGGTSLVYSTYFGGSGSEIGRTVRVDSQGDAYIAGYTDSSDLPTAHAYQASAGAASGCNPAANGDAFLAKFSPDGASLLYGTYLGGCLAEDAYGLAIDNSGHAYLAGDTSSTNFPTKNAYQASSTGGQHAYVAKFDTTQSGASSLVYSTYLKGSGSDTAQAIAVDSAGDAYVTGATQSADFPTTAGAYQTAFASSEDAFVTELGPGGNALVYSTYVGRAGAAAGVALALDAAGGAAVLGETSETDWITTTNALQPAYGGGYQTAVVFHLNPSGSQLLYSTYLGGNYYEVPAGIAVDGAGTIYAVGTTYSANFPVQDALQPQLDGVDDGFVTAIGASGALAWSTFLGGSGYDGANAVALDAAGNLYVTGGTQSSDFPTTPNALQSTYASPGYWDIFLVTLSGRGGGYTPGTIPWHPHSEAGGLGAIGGGIGLSVDLADGHADVTVSGLSLPGRGPDLTLNRTWDSLLAQTAGGAGASGPGLAASVTPHMGGTLAGTVVYTDATGAVWDLPYVGPQGASGPYSSYRIPPGQPWQLTASTAGYTLTDFLSGETWTFDAQGRFLAQTDAYGNSDTLTQGANGPTQEANSGGRSLTFGYTNGALTDAQSPLWQNSGGAQGQHVTYGYNSSGQLTGRTLGAGTSDAVTATFGYSGTLLTGITTAANRTWTLGYDGQGRVVSVSSPASGTVGQPGYTPSYTTQYSYGLTQTTEVRGVGTSGALTTIYTLDAQGEPLAVTDGLGHSTATSYDQDHDPTSVTEANGQTTTDYYQYVGPTASVGLITQTVQPAIQPYSPINGLQVSPIITHTYDPTTYDLLATGQPEGGLTRYAYDGHHSVVTTTQEINGLDCEPTPCPPVWRGAVNTYDQYGEPTGTIDGRAVTVSAAGVASVDAAKAPLYTSHQTYASSGDLQSASTPPITTTLNGTLRVAAPVTTTYGYDGDGDQTSVQSANGNTTTSAFDHLGRPISTTLPAVKLYTGATVNPVETTGYDKDGNVARSADANGDVTQDSYDPLGRLTVETNPVSGTTVYTYNATEQTAAQDPLGNVTTSQYDAAGQLTQATDPVSGTVQYGYDPAGNTTAITSGDASGAITQTEAIGYDALDEPTTDTIGGPGQPPTTTLTAYTLDGSVAQVQQPDGDVVYNTYDAADELLSTEIDPGPTPLNPTTAATHSTYDTYTYDGAGNTTLHVDADGRASTTQYDGDNRAVQMVDATSAPTGTTTITTTPSYDPDGDVLTQTTQTRDATSPGVVATHTYTDTYNAADWVMSSGDDGKATSYGYDAAGQERTQTQYDPTTITTALDPEGRATGIGEVTNGTGPYTSTFGYNQDDQPLTATLANGVQQSAQYDAAGNLRSLSTSGAAGLSPSADSYGYNKLGWTTSATGISGTDTITHNALGRITAESGPSVLSSIPGRAYHWTYDGNGNILTGIDDVGTVYTNTYSASQPNQLVQSYDPDPHSNPTNTTYFAYDSHGDTTAITTSGALTASGAVSTGITYDAQERPITITHKDADYSTNAGAVFDTISLAYNAAGLRSRYTVAVSGTAILDQRFSYRDDGSIGRVAAVTATLNSNGSIKSTGAYTDTFVYTQDGEPLEFVRQQNGQTNRYWYVLDGRNNVVAVTDSGGKVVDSYAYDLWGEPLPGLTAQQVPQQLRYGGYWQDDAVGWYWATTRYYDPELMRWMQPDASELDGVHTYVYVGDDPIDLTDPLGLLTCSGSHDVLSWLGNAACNVGNFAGNVGQGAWNGATDTWTGLVSVGQGALNSTVAIVYDPRAFRQQWQANGTLANYLTHHPLAAGQAVVVGLVAPCGNAVRSGNVGRAVGRCGFDLVVLVGGTKGLTKIGILGRVGRASDVGRAAAIAAELEAAASSSGPTIRFVTALDQAPSVGRTLSTAAGDNAEELARAAGAGRSLYVADIPRALIDLLERYHMARRITTEMGGVRGTEWQFSPEASRYVARFFRRQ